MPSDVAACARRSGDSRVLTSSSRRSRSCSRCATSPCSWSRRNWPWTSTACMAARRKSVPKTIETTRPPSRLVRSRRSGRTTWSSGRRAVRSARGSSAASAPGRPRTAPAVGAVAPTSRAGRWRVAVEPGGPDRGAAPGPRPTSDLTAGRDRAGGRRRASVRRSPVCGPGGRGGPVGLMAGAPRRGRRAASARGLAATSSLDGRRAPRVTKRALPRAPHTQGSRGGQVQPPSTAWRNRVLTRRSSPEWYARTATRP